MATAAGNVFDLIFSGSHLFPHTNKKNFKKTSKPNTHDYYFKLQLSFQRCQLSFHEPQRKTGFTRNDCKVIIAHVMATSFKPLGFFSGRSLDFAVDSVRKSLVDLSGKADLLAFKVKVFYFYFLFCTNTAVWIKDKCPEVCNWACLISETFWGIWFCDLFFGKQVELQHFAGSIILWREDMDLIWQKINGCLCYDAYSSTFFYVSAGCSALKSDLIWLIHFKQDDSDSFTTFKCKCVNVLPSTLFLTGWTFIVFSQFGFTYNLRLS